MAGRVTGSRWIPVLHELRTTRVHSAHTETQQTSQSQSQTCLFLRHPRNKPRGLWTVSQSRRWEPTQRTPHTSCQMEPQAIILAVVRGQQIATPVSLSSMPTHDAPLLDPPHLKPPHPHRPRHSLLRLHRLPQLETQQLHLPPPIRTGDEEAARHHPLLQKSERLVPSTPERLR